MNIYPYSCPWSTVGTVVSLRSTRAIFIFLNENSDKQNVAAYYQARWKETGKLDEEGNKVSQNEKK